MKDKEKLKITGAVNDLNRQIISSLSGRFLLPKKRENVDTHTFNILSICSGVGGLELGLKLAVPNSHTIAYVEGEAYTSPQKATLRQKKMCNKKMLHIL